VVNFWRFGQGLAPDCKAGHLRMLDLEGRAPVSHSGGWDVRRQIDGLAKRIE
jgi:hypothetical protein